MFYKVRNRTGFCITSENNDDYGSFINELRNSRIQFYGLAYNKDKLYGYVRTSDIKALEELAGKYKYTTEIISKKGIWYSTNAFHARYGLFAGFIAAILLISFLNNRIMIIEIGGNKILTDKNVLELLEDVGLGYGSGISDIDLRQAERRIISMEKGISWIGIRNTGSRLVVELSEVTDAPELVRKNDPCNIVATRDAQIKQVRLYSGMLIPMVGDGIKKGDIIVSGVIDEKYGGYHYVHSIAEITGEYKESITFSEPFICEETIHTKTITKKTFTLFGKRFAAWKNENIPNEYEYSENEQTFSLGKITLPFSVIEMNYRLKDTIVTERTEDEVIALIKEKISSYQKNFIGDDVIIRDIQTEKNSDNEKITITVTYTLEGEIGTEKPLFVNYKDITNTKKFPSEDKK